MFRQDRTNPSTAVSNWKGRRDSKKGHPQTAVSSWLNGGLFGVPFVYAEAAYFAGGTSPTTDIINKFAFSNDGRTTLAQGLSVAKSDLAGAANSGVAAYFAGGSGGPVTTVDKFAFDADSRTTLGTGLSLGRSGISGAANSGTAAYFAGGWSYEDSVSAYNTTVDKFAFSDDGRTTLSTGRPSAPQRSLP